MPHEFSDDTLDDIKSRDIDNLSVMHKKHTERHFFESVATAAQFASYLIFSYLESEGIVMSKITSESKDPEHAAKRVDELLSKKKIKIEDRSSYDSEEDKWREGVYIYKGSEIVIFVGRPTFNKLAGRHEVKTCHFKSGKPVIISTPSGVTKVGGGIEK